MSKKKGRPFKEEKPLSEFYKLRVTEDQKELIMSAGTTEFWRNHMVEQAKKIKEHEVDFENLEVKEKLKE